MFVHVLPQVLPLAALYGSVAIGWAILAEAAASFLGFGDPDSISWGVMLQDAYANQALGRGAWNWFTPPGLAIVLMVLAGFPRLTRVGEAAVPETGRAVTAAVDPRSPRSLHHQRRHGARGGWRRSRYPCRQHRGTGGRERLRQIDPCPRADGGAARHRPHRRWRESLSKAAISSTLPNANAARCVGAACRSCRRPR